MAFGGESIEELMEMARLDWSRAIQDVTLPDPVWQWLDLLGDVIACTQHEAAAHTPFRADTDFKRLILLGLQKDISTLNAIHLLLRSEFVHQAAAEVRLLCESVVTFRFVAIDPDERAKMFWEYRHIESYEVVASALKWERSSARSEHVAQIENFIAILQAEYDRTRPLFTGTFARGRRQGKPRRFSNWCDRKVSQQADDCGPDLTRLYAIVYKQMSAYVHGSAWSLRRQLSYARETYDERVVLVDIATIVRTTILVWLKLAEFCDHVLGWNLLARAQEIVERLDSLDDRQFPVRSGETNV